MKRPDPIDGYEDPKPFSAKAIEHWVYKSKTEGPPVIIMHELPGLTKECRALADKIGAAGFRVYMPLFFGKPESSATVRNTLRICIRKEFYAFAGNRTSPIVEWLRALVSHVSNQENADRVGVIGMCLTGNFALTLIAHANVGAAVSCQPSLPLLRENGLAMTPKDQKAAVEAAQEMGPGAIIGFRYELDRVCPAGRFDRIEKTFGDTFDSNVFPGKGHATLTRHLHPEALAKTMVYLQEKLP